MFIIYTTEDGKSQIQLRAENDTVWLSQLEIAELFNATKQNISLHLKNLIDDGELSPGATVKESLTVQKEGKREVQRKITLYNLEAILAVGYRVRSPRGVQFRRWASTVLKEYLLKGFVIDDQRLKNPDGLPGQLSLTNHQRSRLRHLDPFCFQNYSQRNRTDSSLYPSAYLIKLLGLYVLENTYCVNVHTKPKSRTNRARCDRCPTQGSWLDYSG